MTDTNRPPAREPEDPTDGFRLPPDIWPASYPGGKAMMLGAGVVAAAIVAFDSLLLLADILVERLSGGGASGQQAEAAVLLVTEVLMLVALKRWKGPHALPQASRKGRAAGPMLSILSLAAVAFVGGVFAENWWRDWCAARIEQVPWLLYGLWAVPLLAGWLTRLLYRLWEPHASQFSTDELAG